MHPISYERKKLKAMQRYLMNFDTRRLPRYEADALVIGSGVAGLTAAWHLAQAGKSVLLAVRDTLFDSNTNKAQGGIAASFGSDDNPELHLADTLVAGAGLTDRDIARLVVTEGPEDIRLLAAHGAEFDRTADGRLALGREGCHCRHRIVHAHGDATGAEVARALNAMVAQEARVRPLEHCYVVDLLVHEGCVYGATALLDGKKVVLRARATVLATGGTGRLFSKTTNPEGATGSGLAMAWRAGAEVMDMEFVQFHPTALALDGCPNFLISEAVRGAGAVLRNGKGERFMPKYHPMAELAPRDVVARCIFKEMQEGGMDHAFLDATGIEGAAQKFPMIAETCRQYGVDIEHDFIPIAPAAHYMMGGVHTDAHGRTNLSGLYACGEAACTGLQGANRLASNSLLEGLVFGRRVAEDIVAAAARAEAQAAPRAAFCAELFFEEHGLREAAFSDTARLNRETQVLMTQYLGIRRYAPGILKAIQELSRLSSLREGYAAESAEELDLRGRLAADLLIARAALRRRESRGAHYRMDYPEKSEKWRHHVLDVKDEQVALDEEKGDTSDGNDVWSGRALAVMA